MEGRRPRLEAGHQLGSMRHDVNSLGVREETEVKNDSNFAVLLQIPYFKHLHSFSNSLITFNSFPGSRKQGRLLKLRGEVAGRD